MVRDFPKSPNQPNEIALTIASLFSADERLETGKFCKMVRKFPPFRFERKKEEYL